MRKKKEKMKIQTKIKILSIAISAVLLALSFYTKDVGVIGNVVIISMILIFGPILFFRYLEYREMKEIESYFPEFLRNVNESINSGMSLARAIRSASRANYGKLTKYVKKISNQISWKVPVEKALRNLQNEIKSPKIKLAIEIIIDTYKSGGDVSSSLDSIAESLTIMEEAESERRTILNQYVVILYAISIIFVIISVAISKFLTPIVQSSLGMPGMETLGDPCINCFGFGCLICEFYRTTASILFFLPYYSPKAYYISLFFYMSMLQSLFTGLIAGQVSEGSVSAGIKHSLIMMTISFVTFSLVLRFGLI
ncbi:MAG: hypothetical protein B6U78_02140 [Candidatus Aenigmarchaeota archaeon ex4484_224]|nr:MAG: hypothetical protein B6U78_02140 [Candidatus Aenigmarchaeota archaeon ex4484_224]